MELTKKLNLDATPLNAGLGDMSYAKNIVATPNDIINEPGFKKLITLIDKTVIGIVSIPNGFVVFCKGSLTDTIEYYENNITEAKKILASQYFNFNVDLPIFGEYTYNYKKDLIISFSEGVKTEANETRIINIHNYGDTQYTILNFKQVELLTLIPNIQYPKLEFTVVKEGSNKVGTYQIAIAYKLQDDTYSNYSVLHKTLHIIPDTLDDNKPGTSISKSIKITAKATATYFGNFCIGLQ